MLVSRDRLQSCQVSMLHSMSGGREPGGDAHQYDFTPRRAQAARGSLVMDDRSCIAVTSSQGGREGISRELHYAACFPANKRTGCAFER